MRRRRLEHTVDDHAVIMEAGIEGRAEAVDEVYRAETGGGTRPRAVCRAGRTPPSAGRAEFAVEYADQNRADYRAFVRAVREGKIKVVVEG